MNRFTINHHRGHMQANRILSPLESIDQFFEPLLAICASFLSRFESRGYLLDVLDVLSDFGLFDLDFVQTSVDAVGETAELLFCESPFSRPSSVGSMPGLHPKPRPFAGREDAVVLPDRR